MIGPKCWGCGGVVNLREQKCISCGTEYPRGSTIFENVIHPEPQPEGEGVKHDQEKDPWHLLPVDALRAIVKVLAFGASKYAPRNWENGMAWSRCYGALLRHITSWWEGEDKDPETGMSHLWHAGCCILFLITYELRGIGKDDRP